jgi:tetratricopeptide (TPR) repeat protein
MGIFERLRKPVKTEPEVPYPKIHEQLLEIDKTTTKLVSNFDEPTITMDWIKKQEQLAPTHWSFKHINNPVEMNYRQQALSKSMIGKFDETIKICRAGLEKFPESPYLLYMVGRSFLDIHEFSKSIEILDYVISKYPDFADCYVERGVCKHNLGDAEGAKKDFLMARKIEPSISLPPFASK